MSNPDSVLSLSLRLGATLCANGLTVAARVADPLLNMFGPVDRRAKRFLTLDGCDHADRLTAAEEKVDVLDPFWSDGGPTEWLGDRPKRRMLDEPLPEGCECEPACDDYNGALVGWCPVPEHHREWLDWTSDPASLFPSGQPTDFDGPVGEYLDPRLLADDPVFGLLGRAVHPTYRAIQEQVEAGSLLHVVDSGRELNMLPNWQAPQSSAGAEVGSFTASADSPEPGNDTAATGAGSGPQSSAPAHSPAAVVVGSPESAPPPEAGADSGHLTRDAAAKLYDQTLRAMHPDQVIEDRLSEIERNEAPIGGEQPVSVGVTGPGADGSARPRFSTDLFNAAQVIRWWTRATECPKADANIRELEALADRIVDAMDIEVVPPATSADQTTSALMAGLITQVRIFRAVIKGDDDHYRYLDELIADADKRAEDHADIGD